MEILQDLAVGLSHAFQPANFLLLCLGILVGVVAGALPGISFVNAMALSLPFTYAMSPVLAMLFLTGIYVGGIFGGSISAVLINIPGSPGSLPATWDGYPMTRRGESAKALGIAVTCSAIGGMVSALLMTFFSPPFAEFALTFDQPEFFAATFLGLVSVMAIAKGEVLPSMLSLFAGLVVASIGLDPLYSVPRLTFGFEILENGISFVVVLIGMFAIGEVLDGISQRGIGRVRHPRPGPDPVAAAARDLASQGHHRARLGGRLHHRMHPRHRRDRRRHHCLRGGEAGLRARGPVRHGDRRRARGPGDRKERHHGGPPPFRCLPSASRAAPPPRS